MGTKLQAVIEGFDGPFVASKGKQDIGEIAACAHRLRVRLQVSAMTLLGFIQPSEPSQQQALVMPSVRMRGRLDEQLPVMRQRLVEATRVFERQGTREKHVDADQTLVLRERRRADHINERIVDVIADARALGTRAREEPEDARRAAAATRASRSPAC